MLGHVAQGVEAAGGMKSADLGVGGHPGLPSGLIVITRALKGRGGRQEFRHLKMEEGDTSQGMGWLLEGGRGEE